MSEQTLKFEPGNPVEVRTRSRNELLGTMRYDGSLVRLKSEALFTSAELRQIADYMDSLKQKNKG